MKKIMFVGLVCLIIGILLSVIYQEAHYYTFFSVGAFIILLNFYNSISKEKLFANWSIRRYSIFAGLIILASISIDKIGLYLGYWIYPDYSSLFDEMLKYIFEWSIALIYIMISLLIGKEMLTKSKCPKSIIWPMALIIFVTLIGLITEYFNHVSGYSWKVLSMPLTNTMIGSYFIMFQTIGYWAMAIIPLLIYKISEKSR